MKVELSTLSCHIFIYLEVHGHTVQYLIWKVSDMVKMNLEDSVVAALLASVRTSWKATIYYINRALLILFWKSLYVHMYRILYSVTHPTKSIVYNSRIRGKLELKGIKMDRNKWLAEVGFFGGHYNLRSQTLTLALFLLLFFGKNLGWFRNKFLKDFSEE